MTNKQKKQLAELGKTGTPVSPCKLAKPKTINQKKLWEALLNNPLVCGIGFAGTGKTFVTGMTACSMLMDGKIKKIIITRPNVPTGRTLGHFPGTVQEKMEPWLAPITSVLRDGLGAAKYEAMFDREIQIQPLETIRGQSFEDTFIIVDESQNLSLDEIKALTTRIGEGSHMALIGDPKQSDVRDGSDLVKFVHMCNKSGIDVPLIEFQIADIVRSEMCKQLITMFYEEGL